MVEDVLDDGDEKRGFEVKDVIRLDLYSASQRLRAKLVLWPSTKCQGQAMRVANDERSDGGRMG